MAGEKQFKASKKKIDKARKDGKVPKAKEISNSIQVLSCSMLVYLLTNLGNDLSNSCHKVMRVRDWEGEGMFLGLIGGIYKGIILKVSFGLVCLFILTFLSELLQVGLSFSLNKVGFKLNNINPLNGLKKILGEREGAKAPLGLVYAGLEMFVFLAVCLFVTFDYSVSVVKSFLVADMEQQLGFLFLEAVRQFLIRFAILSVVYATYKYLMSYRRINKDLMMDFDELKQESKEDEGDPHFKGHRKSLHQEVLMHGSIQNVRRAKVLIVSD